LSWGTTIEYMWLLFIDEIPPLADDMGTDQTEEEEDERLVEGVRVWEHEGGASPINVMGEESEHVL
jgi:hypothetical protein